MPGDMKNRMTQPVKSNKSGFLWLFSGLMIGLFVAFLTYLQTQPKSDVSFSDAVNQEINKAKQHKEEKKQRREQNPDKNVPKFDFYTILKDYEVFVPESEVSTEKKTLQKMKKRTPPSPKMKRLISCKSVLSSNTVMPINVAPHWRCLA